MRISVTKNSAHLKSISYAVLSQGMTSGIWTGDEAETESTTTQKQSRKELHFDA